MTTIIIPEPTAPRCSACDMTLQGVILHGITNCGNCGATVSVSFKGSIDSIEYETKVVG